MRSFISNHFDGKTVDELKRTITPDWSRENAVRQLGLMGIPDRAKRVFEIGCGIGRLLHILAEDPERELAGCDASRAMIQEAKPHERISYSLCSGDGDLPWPPESFDAGFSIITFQHIPSTDTVLRYVDNAMKCLVGGGSFSCQVLADKYPDKGELWSFHSPKDIHDQMWRSGAGNVWVEVTGPWVIMWGQK